MVIEFSIPHGAMRINADEFFREAARGRIRRMLKLIKKSDPDPEPVREIREYLDSEIRALNDKAKDSAGKYMTSQTRLKEAEQHYRQMQNPCHPVYTTDKDQLAEAKKGISRCRAAVTTANRTLKEAAELAGKYQGVLEDVEKICDSGERMQNESKRI